MKREGHGGCREERKGGWKEGEYSERKRRARGGRKE